MTLAIVQFGVAIVMAMIASWTGMLVSIALALPDHTDRAERSLDGSARRCAARGIAGVLTGGVLAALIRLPMPLVKLACVLGLLALGCALAVGSSGLARLLGRRIGQMSGAQNSFGALVRGSAALSFGMLFPLLGWYLLLPLSLIFGLGAGIGALLPQRAQRQPEPESLGSELQGAL